MTPLRGMVDELLKSSLEMGERCAAASEAHFGTDIISASFTSVAFQTCDTTLYCHRIADFELPSFQSGRANFHHLTRCFVPTTQGLFDFD